MRVVSAFSHRMIALLVLLALPANAQNLISTYAGTDWIFPSNIIAGRQAPLGKVRAMASDGQGNVYVADYDNNIVFQLNGQGVVRIFAGNGIEGFSGDNGLAVNASLSGPEGVLVDAAGNVIIADTGNHRVRRVTPDGVITTIAGTGVNGFSGDGGDALQARLNSPRGMAMDGAGNLYIADLGSRRIRLLQADGTIRTIAGNGNFASSGDGQPAVNAEVAPFNSMVIDQEGNLIFSEPDFSRIRAIDRNGIVRTIAGNGTYANAVNNTQATNSPLRGPRGLVLDSRGTLYFAETNGYRIFRISPEGILQVVAGNGTNDYDGDGQSATAAPLGFPESLAFDGSGRIVFSDTFCTCIRAFSLGGTIDTVAGNGRFGRAEEGAPVSRAFLFTPRGLAFDRSGNLIVVNTDADRLDRFSRQGTYSHLAGRAGGCCSDNGPAREALLSFPNAVAVDAQNRIYFSETDFDLIRRIDTNGVITTFAGNRREGFTGDGGPATQASLGNPNGLAFDSAGNLYVADRTNRRIRRITPAGVISTFAGDGQQRYAGDNGPALSASFSLPYALAVNASGDLLVADPVDNRIRRITTAGVITTFAGNGRAVSAGDGGAATLASINGPGGLAIDQQGRVYVLESGGDRIRRIDTNGIITTIAGNGRTGFTGDGGPATAASVDTPEMGIAVAANGDVFFSDTSNNRIRVIRSIAPKVSVDPTTLTLSTRARQALPPTALQIRSTTTGVLFSARARTTNGGNWLTVDLANGAAPTTIRVTADVAQLPPGRYTGFIDIATPAADPSSLSVPVNLTVLEALVTSNFSVSTQNLTFTLDPDSSDQRTLTVASDNVDLNVTASVATDSGGAWLRVSPDRVIATNAGASLTVSVASAGLAPGTYTGSLLLRSGEQLVRVPVNLVVKAQTKPQILVSQSGLSFTAVAGGGTPAAQPFGILNEGTGEMSWDARTITLAGNDWLRIDSPNGRVNQPLSDISSVNVSVQHAGLAPGEYYGRVEITAPSDNSPQSVMVILRVLPEGSAPPPEVRPAGLVFTAAEGGTPGSQTISINNLVSSDTQFASSRLTFDGAQWFTHSPGNAAVVPNDPRSVVVQPDLRALSPGVRRGAITFVFADGAIRTVSLLSVVAPRGSQSTEKEGATRNLGGCGSPNLNINFTSLRDDFVAIVGQPTTVEVKVVDDCGNLLTPQSGPGVITKANFTNDVSTSLTHIGNGVWTGSLKPTKPASGTVFLSVVLNLNNRLFLAQRTGTIQVQGRTPIIVQGSLRHSATFDTDVPVSPGQLISVLGGNLADGQNSATLPLPLELNQTEVLLGGRSLPLLFTSDGQINAQVPYDLATNTQQQLLVRRGSTISMPEQFVVADSQPGIFTRNERGFGPATITKSDGNTLIDPANPSQRGEEVIVFCTGLGRTDPAIEPGQPAPDPGPRVVADVQVSVGGVAAEVRSATLSPGAAGRYQVRFVVPTGVATGDEVPVIVTAAGRSSQMATMPVR